MGQKAPGYSQSQHQSNSCGLPSKQSEPYDQKVHRILFFQHHNIVLRQSKNISQHQRFISISHKTGSRKKRSLFCVYDLPLVWTPTSPTARKTFHLVHDTNLLSSWQQFVHTMTHGSELSFSQWTHPDFQMERLFDDNVEDLSDMTKIILLFPGNQFCLNTFVHPYCSSIS